MIDGVIALVVGAGMLGVWWRMSEVRARQADFRLPNRSLGAGVIMIITVGLAATVDRP